MDNSFEKIADSLIYYMLEHPTKNKTKYEIFNEWSNYANLDFRGNNQMSGWCLDCIQTFIGGVNKDLLKSILNSN